jgi:hypothetical protein
MLPKLKHSIPVSISCQSSKATSQSTRPIDQMQAATATHRPAVAAKKMGPIDHRRKLQQNAQTAVKEQAPS